jgi:hypothetical protein
MRKRDRIAKKTKARWCRRYVLLAKRMGFKGYEDAVEYDPSMSPEDAWALECSYMDWE